MNKSKTFFIRLLSDYIKEKKTIVTPDIDWTLIKQLSRSHKVDGIVFFQCKDFMPTDVYEYFSRASSATLFRYVNRRAELNSVCSALRNAGIAFIVVKGFEIADYYPVPSLRTMGDCDIIVKREYMALAMDVMRSLGFNGIENDMAHSWECTKNGFLFEIHDSLVQSVEHVQPSQAKFFNEFDKYIRGEKLDCSFHFLFIIMHLRKHFMNSGVGIRQFMDIAVLTKSDLGLDWRWIEKKLAELGLAKFAKCCFFLNENWFGVKPPIQCATMDQEFYEQVTEKVLGNGVFGGQDASNKGNYERIVLIKSKGAMWHRRFSLLFENAFPNYEYMQGYPECGYLYHRPYLLPVAWIHRMLLYFQRKQRTTVRRVWEGAFTQQEELDKQREYLKKMGL